ncbi:MAG: ribulokinase [Victivallaceae bacterium]|nr:ribulokinase [Victivallaceae bacterium]
MMSKFTIGLDFGTDSVRALLVNAATGGEIACSVHGYARWRAGKYCNAEVNQFRQHPEDYLIGLEAVVRDILRQAPAGTAENVIGISVDTTGSTPVAVDRSGTPLAMTAGFEDNPDAMFILWKDHTAIQEAEEITRHAKNWGGKDFTRFEGGIYSSEWFWAKLLRTLRVDEKVRQAAFSWVEHCDWIPAVLTGNTDPLTMKRSRCAGGHKAMWHKAWHGLPPEAFLRGIDPLLTGWRERLYDHTYTSDTAAGNLSPEWAEKLGLSTEVTVGVGALDCHFGAVGAQIEPYLLSKVMGTSTCDIVVVPAAELKDKVIKGICGQVDGSVIPDLTGLEAGQSAFGDVYAWFKHLLAWPLEHFALEGREEALSRLLPALEQAAAKTPIGQSGAAALDWFNGRRTPDANQKLTGAIFGLNLASSAPLIYRALCEATVFGAKRIVDHFMAEGVTVKGIIALGGIAQKSPFVMQMCADVLDLPVKVAKSEQSCALGAAMFAAVTAGYYPDVETAMKAMGSGFETTYQPIPANTARYAGPYRNYCRYAALVERENTIT